MAVALAVPQGVVLRDAVDEIQWIPAPQRLAAAGEFLRTRGESGERAGQDAREIVADRGLLPDGFAVEDRNGAVILPGDSSRTAKNSVFVFTPAETGIYDIIVRAESGAGEFSLRTTLPGDANLDGNVDGRDFNLWMRNRFQAERKLWTDGDFNGDGSVDGSDFNIWNKHRFTSVNDLPSFGILGRVAARTPRASNISNVELESSPPTPGPDTANSNSTPFAASSSATSIHASSADRLFAKWPHSKKLDESADEEGVGVSHGKIEFV